MITKKDILTELEKFNLPYGRPVIVHTSLKAIGEIEGGAEGLLSALVQCFTQGGGLLCVPTHTWDKLRLDLRRAESCIGVLPQIAAGREEGVRSLHPTHSITVFGNRERAEKFVELEKNSDTPTNPQGCYGNFYRENGYILLLGVNHTKNTFLHCVEELMEVPGRLTSEKIESEIIYKDGSSEKRFLYWFDERKIPDVSLNFGKFEKAFEYHGCIQRGKLGNAKTQLCSAAKMKSVMELVYKNAGGEELLANDLPLDECLYKNNEGKDLI